MRKVFSFLGCDHKCGTSMIAQSVAEAVAGKKKDLKILLIHTERDENTIFSPNVSESLESIRPYLAERLVDMSELAEKSRYKDNLYIIGGNKQLGSSFMLSPDMSEYLIAAAASVFDIVICDCGCDVENGLCLGSLFSANDIYLVATSSEAALRKQEYHSVLYEQINIPLNRLVINKYNKRDINTAAIICARLKFRKENVFVVCASDNGERAEAEGQSIYSMKDFRFKKEIDKIADDLIERSKYDEL